MTSIHAKQIGAVPLGGHKDDAVFTPATDRGTPIMGLLDDVTPDSVDEGDAGIVRMSANRNLYNTIRDAGGNERGLNIDTHNQASVISTEQRLSDNNNFFSAIAFEIVIGVDTETDFMIIKNPSASGFNIKIKTIQMVVDKAPLVQVYRNPTITTDGTTVTPANLRDPLVTASATVFHSPTISDRGTLLYAEILEMRPFIPTEMLLQMLPNSNLLITVQPELIDKDHTMTILFAEETA